MKQRVRQCLSVLAGFCFFLVMPLSGFAKDVLYVPVVNGLQIIDCDTDTVIETIPAYKDYVAQAGFSPDKKRYYLNAYDAIYAFDTNTRKLVDTYKFSHPLSRVTVIGFAVSEDSRTFYLSCTIVKKKHNIPKLNVLPLQLVIYDIQKKSVVTNFDIPYGVSGLLTLRNDPDHLMVLGRDVYKMDLRNGKLEKVLGLFNPEAGEEVKNSFVMWNNSSPGDHGIFMNPYYTQNGIGYFIIDRNTGEVSTLKGKDFWMEYSTILSPDKQCFYGLMDDLVKIDFKTGDTIKSIPMKTGTNYALATTSDGKKVYVGPAGNDLSVYDASTLELLKVIPLSGDGAIIHRLSQ